MAEFSNKLTDAQAERLAILLEEMGEAQQAIGKILRHGYESFDPTGKTVGDNRFQLTRELGDVTYAITAITVACDVNKSLVDRRVREKAEKIGQYLHHQEPKP